MDLDPTALADQLAEIDSLPLNERAAKLAALHTSLREALDSPNPS
jgi:hypothetical protein